MRYVLGAVTVLLVVVTLLVLLGGPSPAGRPDRTVTVVVTLTE